MALIKYFFGESCRIFIDHANLYVTFRAFLAFFSSFLIAISCGDLVIRWLKKLQGAGQPIRLEGPESHLQTKVGTPTMGGVLILLSAAISMLIFCDFSNAYVVLLSLITLSFAAIGGMDDYWKIKAQNSKGIAAKWRLGCQLVVGLFFTFFVMHLGGGDGSYCDSCVFFPFWPGVTWNLSFFYLIFASYVIAGTANAVNLTDGLDGLVTLPVMMVLTFLGILAYYSGLGAQAIDLLQAGCNKFGKLAADAMRLASFAAGSTGVEGVAMEAGARGAGILGSVAFDVASPMGVSVSGAYAKKAVAQVLVPVKDAAEIAVFAASLVGACGGFLWFNVKPAKVFMGDVGSLALGAAIGGIGVILKQELLLAVIGGLFVIETLSVIVQVFYFKWSRGKRIFLMSPLHHHFEKKGWSETLIVGRFWLLSLLFIMLGLFGLLIKALAIAYKMSAGGII